jgi:ABC-2 type transport system ATP-binding protein
MTTDNILAVDDVEFADAPTVVSVKNVSKRFVIRRDNSLKERIVTLGRAGRRHSEDFWALKDVTLDIPAGTTIGLLGPNGSGKSTLLKVIGGILEPTTGEVSRRGRLAALIELGAGFHPDLTGRENVFLNAAILGITQEEAEAKFDDILLFSGIGDFIDTQVKFYSSGMYVRLAFAVAIHTDPDVLLVDEVLAVGDEQFQKKCLDKIREFQQEGRTIVLVSHSLGQVQELCDSAVVLHHGEVMFQGSARHAVKNFREILEGRRIAEAEAANPEADATPGSVDKVEIAAPCRTPPLSRSGTRGSRSRTNTVTSSTAPTAARSAWSTSPCTGPPSSSTGWTTSSSVAGRTSSTASSPRRRGSTSRSSARRHASSWSTTIVMPA